MLKNFVQEDSCIGKEVPHLISYSLKEHLDINWHHLDQRRIDSRLLMMYKVTNDPVAIPGPEYLV